MAKTDRIRAFESMLTNDCIKQVTIRLWVVHFQNEDLFPLKLYGQP